MNIKQFLDNLFEVIENGDANEVRYCILEGLKNFEEILPLDKAYLKRNTNILDYQDQNGKTALMRASELGKIDAVDFLIQYGACVDLKDNMGRTALIYAVKEGKENVVKTLIENKADINVQTKNKHTPLHYAAIYNLVGVAKILAEKGCETHLRDDRGKSPLMLNDKEEFRRAVIDASMVYFQKRLRKGRNKAFIMSKKRRGL